MTLFIENRRNGKTELVDSVWHGDELRLAKLAAWRVAQYASAYPAIIRRARAGWRDFP